MAQMLSGQNSGGDRRSIRSSKLIDSRESLDYDTGANEEVFMHTIFSSYLHFTPQCFIALSPLSPTVFVFCVNGGFFLPHSVFGISQYYTVRICCLDEKLRTCFHFELVSLSTLWFIQK